MTRFWRIVLGLSFSLAILLALGLFIERWRGQRALAAATAELKARGTLPIPEELFAPPGPSNGLFLLISAADRLRTPPSAPAMKVIQPGRAVSSFDRTWWEEGSRSNTWNDSLRWARDHQNDLTQLHRALAFPDCRTDLDWQQGFKMLLPDLAKKKSAARSLAAAAQVAAYQGDKAGALSHLTALRRLEETMAGELTLICQLVRIACGAIALPCFWDIAHRDDWSEADLAALQAALPSENYSAALSRSLQGEAALWIQSIRTMSGRDYVDMATLFPGNDSLSLPTGLDEVVPFADELFSRSFQGFRATVLYPLWRFAWSDQAIAYHLRVSDEQFRRSVEAGAAQSLQSHSDDAGARMQSMGWYDHLRFSFTVHALFGNHRALAKALRLETERALMETMIALRRFRLRHDRFPERLEELVPGFLAKEPVDRMDGQPLRYRRNPDGSYALWSAGEDFSDEGGDATPKHRQAANLHWWNGRDAVLPTPASAEQVTAWAMEEAKKAKRNQASPISSLSPELLRRYGLTPMSNTNSPPLSPAP